MADLWIKFYVKDLSDPRILDAGGHEAGWLHLAAKCHAREHMTNGLIKAAVVPVLVPTMKKPLVVATELVRVGLWEARPDGFYLTDYLTDNPTKEEVLGKREKWKDTKRTQRGSNEDKRNVHDGQNEDTQRTSRARVRAHSHSLSNSGSEVLDLGKKDADEIDGAPPAWREAAPRAQTAFPSPRMHGGCYDAPAACARGLCVPAFLGNQWQLQLAAGKPSTFAASGAVVARVNAIVDRQPAGLSVADLLPWWRDQWKAFETVSRRAGPSNQPGTLENAWDDGLETLLNRCEPPVRTIDKFQWFAHATLVDDVLTVQEHAVEYVTHAFLDRLCAAHGGPLTVAVATTEALAR